MRFSESTGRRGEDEAQLLGAVVCTSCESVYKIDDHRLSCANCGEALQLGEPAGQSKPRRDVGTYSFLKPVASLVDRHLKSVGLLQEAGGPSMRQQVLGLVTCGWCGKSHPRRPDVPNCDACGGVLPLPPSSDPGLRPPPAPRTLPAGFQSRLYFSENLGGWFGVFIMGVSFLFVCAMGPFAILVFLFGFASAHSNFLTAQRRLKALRFGQPVLGRIESVHMIGEPHGGRPMFRLYFRFDVNGQPYRGMKTTYDRAVTARFVGEPLWVVVAAENPAAHDLWPPLA